MGRGQILDMDIIPDSGTIGGGIIGTENGNRRAFAQGRLATDLDKVGRLLDTLPHTCQGVGSGNVKIAKRDIAEAMGQGHVPQHPFAHKLGGTVGVYGQGWRIFRGTAALRHTVHGRGTGKDKLLNTGPHARLEETKGIAGIVSIIVERQTYRLRGNDRCGKVKNGRYSEVPKRFLETCLIGKFRYDQLFTMNKCVSRAGRKIVKNDWTIPGLGKLPDNMSSYVPGSAGNQKILHVIPSFTVI
jgi:hypothetical protein